MADKSWKQFERRVSARFGLKRRGAHTSGQTLGEGSSDAVQADGRDPNFWAIECKLMHRLNYQTILDACKQAERNRTRDLQCPIAVVKQPRRRDQDALVVMRFDQFCEWYVGEDTTDGGESAPTLRVIG